MSEPPDKVVCTTDPGDDTQRRFRYQATQAAILALALLDDETDLDEIFCEHHEDILLKQRKGKFVGYQVKTRQDGAEPLKAIDEEAVSSIQRFISLDTRFGPHFSHYVLGSSCGFWKQEKNGSNLPHLLELADATRNGSVPSLLERYLKKLCPKPKAPTGSRRRAGRPAGEADGTPGPGDVAVNGPSYEELLDRALTVLQKVRAETLPGLRDIDAVLIKLIRQVATIGDRLYSELEAVAQALVTAMFNAASLAHNSPRERYLSLCLNPSEVAVEETITGKRIARYRLLDTIQAALPLQPTLCTSNHFSIQDLPRGIGKLELKLAASGLSVANIDLAKDHKASAEFFLTQLLQKHGRKIADTQYQHLRTLVRTECQEAHDRARQANQPFGSIMLDEVRQRLRARHQADKDGLFGCKYEHLLGVAGVLTEDCTLWWSDPFSITEEERS